MDSRTTIYALSTGKGVAGIAVVRVSGDNALKSLVQLTKKKEFSPRMLTYTTLYNNQDDAIDKAMVAYFPKGKSYTGEPMVEYHIHGGRAVIKSLLEALSHMSNHRMAEAGEFTKKAVENGKMDLLQAEAVQGVLQAKTTKQQKQALRQLHGEHSTTYNRWSKDILRLVAHMEATLDFSDEDIPITLNVQIQKDLKHMQKEMAQGLQKAKAAQRVHDGIRIAIIGKPNVGKSSLLNALAHQDIAIVSEEAGTTRDALSITLEIEGYNIIIIDTAGIRHATNAIEQEGIRRAKAAAQGADIILWMRDIASVYDQKPMDIDDGIPCLEVINKDDEGIYQKESNNTKQVWISCKTEKGLDTLKEAITDMVEALCAGSEDSMITSHRHQEHLERCTAAIREAIQQDDMVLKAHHMHRALTSIGHITGAVSVEAVLGEIFKGFCIGK